MKRSQFLKRAAVIGGSIVFFNELPAAQEKAFATLSPLPEGSTLTSWGDSRIIEFGFERAARMPWHMEKFDPVLLRRSLPLKPAMSTEVKWRGGYNVTQILRTQFSSANMEVSVLRGRGEFDSYWARVAQEALKYHLKSVEQLLEHSVREKTEPPKPLHLMTDRDWETYRPIQTMGGARQLLGRLPRPYDTFVLRPLRDLALLTHRQPNDSDMRTDEWLSEITLEAHR